MISFLVGLYLGVTRHGWWPLMLVAPVMALASTIFEMHKTLQLAALFRAPAAVSWPDLATTLAIALLLNVALGVCGFALGRAISKLRGRPAGVPSPR